MSVYDITLQDPTEKVAPPGKVLRVTAVAQMVFVSICTYDETHDTQTVTAEEQIAVSLPALRQALQLLSDDDLREEGREKDKRGELGARIGGERFGLVPL